MTLVPKHCQACGSRLQPVPGGPHLRCEQCEEVFYRNPAVGVAVIVLRGRDILLGRRMRGRYAGLWCIPCGYVEWDEDVRGTARREFREETGLEVDLGEVFTVHSNFHDRSKQTVGIWFRGKVVGGSIAAGDDLDMVRYFDIDAVPQLAFATDALVIEELRMRYSRGR